MSDEDWNVPLQTVARLTGEVMAVCPIVGVSVGRWKDRTSWRADFIPHATEAQRAEAYRVMMAFDIWQGAEPPADAGNSLDVASYERAIGMTREDVPHDAFGDYSRQNLAPVEEDPGEQDLGAEMLAAEVEAGGGGEPAGENAEHDTGPGEQDQVAGAVDHGGVLIHYDQVEIARAQIAMKVSDHEEILVGALSSRWPDLTAAFRDTNNLSPHLWSDQQGADRMEFMRLSQIESSIRGHAVNLRRAVKDADADQLRNIDAHLAEGWPT